MVESRLQLFFQCKRGSTVPFFFSKNHSKLQFQLSALIVFFFCLLQTFNNQWKPIFLLAFYSFTNCRWHEVNLIENKSPSATNIILSYIDFFLQSLGQKNTNKSGGSPSISITPLPGRNNPGASTKKSTSSTSSNSNSNANQMKPGQPGQGQGGKGNFVICEICDGYIKDLEQLRNHMQWIHKVKLALVKNILFMSLLFNIFIFCS